MRWGLVLQSSAFKLVLSISGIVTLLSVNEVNALSFVKNGSCYCNPENEKVCLVEYYFPSQNGDPSPSVSLWVPFGPCDKGVTAPAAPRIDIRADGNRDGMVSVEPGGSDPDEKSEASWSFERGAIVLPNLDDDGGRGTFNEYRVDSDDDIINGPEDLDDFALIRIIPLDPSIEESFSSVEAMIEAPLDRVNIFYRTKEQGRFTKWEAQNNPLTMDQLISGVELRVESKIVAEKMDERFINVTVRMNSQDNLGYYHESSDTVQLRVAPILFHNHLDEAEQLLISPIEEVGTAHVFEDFKDKMSDAAAEIGIPLSSWPIVDTNVSRLVRWMQDIAEWGYATAPRVGGGLQKMRFIVLNDFHKGPGSYLGIRSYGRDIALIAPGDDTTKDGYGMLEAAGNFEVLPPLLNRRWGNVIRGSKSILDSVVTAFLQAQELQPEFPDDIDTKWLSVGHIDELFSFLPAPQSKNGWKLLYADSRLAMDLLRNAPPEFKTFLAYDGKYVNEFLKDYQNAPQLVDQSIIDSERALASLVNQAGLNPYTDVIRVPVLFGVKDEDTHRINNISGNIVNGALINRDGRKKFLAPKPWGPTTGLNQTDRDLFAEYAAREIKRATGIEVTWIDTFFAYHIYGGGVHCASNVIRKIPDQPWWSPINTKAKTIKRRVPSRSNQTVTKSPKKSPRVHRHRAGKKFPRVHRHRAGMLFFEEFGI